MPFISTDTVGVCGADGFPRVSPGVTVPMPFPPPTLVAGYAGPSFFLTDHSSLSLEKAQYYNPAEVPGRTWGETFFDSSFGHEGMPRYSTWAGMKCHGTPPSTLVGFRRFPRVHAKSGFQGWVS